MLLMLGEDQLNQNDQRQFLAGRVGGSCKVWGKQARGCTVSKQELLMVGHVPRTLGGSKNGTRGQRSIMYLRCLSHSK